jgi:hypothetical protein
MFSSLNMHAVNTNCRARAMKGCTIWDRTQRSGTKTYINKDVKGHPPNPLNARARARAHIHTRACARAHTHTHTHKHIYICQVTQHNLTEVLCFASVLLASSWTVNSVIDNTIFSHGVYALDNLSSAEIPHAYMKILCIRHTGSNMKCGRTVLWRNLEHGGWEGRDIFSICCNYVRAHFIWHSLSLNNTSKIKQNK